MIHIPGNQVRMFEHPSGRPLPTREDLNNLCQAAEDQIGRLRAEIDRLRKMK
jgi:hypothetical protein